MVLLHGFTDTWQGWTPVLPLLEAHHAVFAPTLPGHFGGEQFSAGQTMTIIGSLDMIERQLDAQGIDKAHLVGSSLGGWAALELAGRGRALSVVGVCPAGGWEHGGPEERAVLRYFKTNDRLIRMNRPMLARTAQIPRLRRFALRDLMTHPENVSASEAAALFNGAAGCAVVRDAIALTEAGDSFGELAAIDCPVRILYGTKDRIVRWPSHYTRMRALLPDADYVPLDGLGHLPMWDDPQLVARRILEVTAPAAVEMAAS
jgi:pimeloyl-ACP methyl ester carboxylesterase